MYKKHKLVTLPTNEKAKITMSLMNILLLGGSHPENNQYKNQHLYILSDDEIKEDGAWYYNNITKSLFIMRYLTTYNPKQDKKIIATTNISLEIYDKELSDMHSTKVNIIMPEIPLQFIEHYVSEFNKGNVISEVLVEYDMTPKPINNNSSIVGYIHSSELKINSDNTINIKPIKESWNREEVEKILKNFSNRFIDNIEMNYMQIVIEEWIEENL